MSSLMFSKQSQCEQELKWAWIWFKQLQVFHNRCGAHDWAFTVDDVIGLLKSKRDAGIPAWKRMKVIEGLIVFRREVQKRATDDLVEIGERMKSIVAHERAKNGGYDSIEDVVGKIDPREMDAIQEFRRALRKNGMKYSTERSYVNKLKAFMADRGLKCLNDFAAIGCADVEAHLTDLAVDGDVAPSTQNAAFYALLKFFTLVLKKDMGRVEAIRATKGKMVPTVMSPGEVGDVLNGLSGVHLVIAKLLYGCGMRISEAIKLRIKDLDFANKQIEIRDSKGGKSRLVPMPDDLVEPLQRWVKSTEVLHRHDIADGIASVRLPHALTRKYPNAHREFRWQFLFPSARMAKDPRTGRFHRHHLHRDTFAMHLRRAVEKARLHKHVTSHTFRHCFATHLLWTGTDIRTIQQLLGHADVKTTEIYTHVRNPKEYKIVSPLDRMIDQRHKLSAAG
jgi:integron integrase